jgi:hypothetical protein
LIEAVFSVLVMFSGGRMLEVYPEWQIVDVSVAGVTAGLVAPGVQAGSGSTEPAAASSTR